jgi:hypothetical protein
MDVARAARHALFRGAGVRPSRRRPRARLTTTDPGYIEVLFCVTGSVQVSELGSDGPVIRLLEDQYVVQAAEEPPHELSAGSGGATIVRVRLLPSATTAAMPARCPSLSRAASPPDVPS